MKVYIVTAGCYSDYHIEAVFTNEAQAELYCALHAGMFDEPSVEEYETDEGQIETAEDYKVRWESTFYEKNSYFQPNAKFTTEDENSITVIRKAESSYYKRNSGDFCKIVVTLDKQIPIATVKKIMQDRVAEWKYERAMNGGDVNE